MQNGQLNKLFVETPFKLQIKSMSVQKTVIIAHTGRTVLFYEIKHFLFFISVCICLFSKFEVRIPLTFKLENYQTKPKFQINCDLKLVALIACPSILTHSFRNDHGSKINYFSHSIKVQLLMLGEVFVQFDQYPKSGFRENVYDVI